MKSLSLLSVVIALMNGINSAPPSGGTYVVEVLLLMDPRALTTYVSEEDSTSAAKDSATEDLKYMVTEVNKFFDSIHDMDLTLSIRDIIFMDTNLVSGYADTEDSSVRYVSMKELLEALDAKIAADNHLQSLGFDIAILMTGFDIEEYGRQNGRLAAGYAHTGAVCMQDHNTGVVEMTGTFDNAFILAHEIGHLLGVKGHDAQSTGYIMAPSTVKRSHNRFSFSRKSANAIWDNIMELDQYSMNCMLRTNAASVVPKRQVTARMANFDNVCKRKRGQEWGYYVYDASNEKVYGNNICDVFFCSKLGGPMKEGTTSEGSPCGASKTCQRGKCLEDASSSLAAQVTDDKCPQGDSLSYHGLSCEGFIAEKGLANFCHNRKNFESSCCKTLKTTCAAKNTPNQCLGDFVNAYRGLSCAEALKKYRIYTFCKQENEKIFKVNCCDTWKTTCSYNKRNVSENLLKRTKGERAIDVLLEALLEEETLKDKPELLAMA